MNQIDLLRKKIREILSEDYRFQYDKNKYFPNEKMKQTCQKAIDAVSKNKLTGKGEAEGTGLRKAYSILRGDSMSHGQLKRMKSFFDGNFNSYKNELSKGKNINNSGLIQKWNLWGGDAAYSWSKYNIENKKNNNQNSKNLRPKGHKNMMDPYNTRTKTALSYVKNNLREAYVDSKGNLLGLNINDDENQESNEFEKIVKKWDAGGRYIGRAGYEYWFPLEAEEELNSIGISPEYYNYDFATEPPYKGQKFIVLVANPKDWN